MAQTTSRKNLTPRQLEILKATSRFQSSKCYSPTIAELASGLSISRSTAFEHIGELRAKGLLTSLPGRARSLILTSRAQELLEQACDSGLRNAKISRRTNSRHATRVGKMCYFFGRLARTGAAVDVVDHAVLFVQKTRNDLLY